MFVTLFNLQGAHHLSAAGFHLTTSLFLCQVLFSNFFKFFFRTRFGNLCVSESCCLATVSDFSTRSSFCQVLFSTFFKIFFTRPLLSRRRLLDLADSFDIIPPHSPFVNTFFQNFLFFSRDFLFSPVSRLFPPKFHAARTFGRRISPCGTTHLMLPLLHKNSPHTQEAAYADPNPRLPACQGHARK